MTAALTFMNPQSTACERAARNVRHAKKAR